MVNLFVDNGEIEAEKGCNLLQACLDNDIYIPNLCFLTGMQLPFASCRLCFVEIKGTDEPVTACTVAVREGMVVQTGAPAVRQLQRTAFQLLMSVHRLDCRNCPANKKCELQRIAKFLKIPLKSGDFQKQLKGEDIDRAHPFFELHPNRCVLCGKCVHVCKEKHGQSALTFSERGFKTTIRYYGESDESQLPCATCAACVDICPVSAITPKAV